MEQDVGTIVLLAAALLGAGAFAGLLAGLLGVGGGIVIVPVLFHIFQFLQVDLSVAMHLAVGTSLSTIIATSVSSLNAHHKRGAVDWPLLRSWGPAVAVGVVAGTVIASMVSGATLTAVFAVLALVIATHLAFSPDKMRVADALPRGVLRFGIGNVIGGLSAMMGIGGGTFTVPTLVMCNYPVHKAVGTASAVGLIIAVPGTIGFVINGFGAEGLPAFSFGFVNLLGFFFLVPMTVIMAPIGARLAHGMNQRWLRRAFALFLAITSIRMFTELV